MLGTGLLCLLGQASPAGAAAGAGAAAAPAGIGGGIAGSLAFGPAGGLPRGLAPPKPPTLNYVIKCSNGQSFKGSLTGSGTIRYPNVPPGTRCTVNPTPAPGLSDASPRAFAPVPAGGVSSVSYFEGAPRIAVSPPDGPPGRTTTVYGTGFPPGRSVTVTWPANLGAPVTAVTDAEGRLVMTIYVIPHSALGDLEIVATGTGFPPVSTTYLVVFPSAEAFGPTQPYVVSSY